MSPTLHAKETLLTAVGRSTDSSARHLLSLQHSDGYWCALLTADTTLESDYILLQLWMYPPTSSGENAGVWNPPDPGRIRRAADRILSRQLPDGGFNIYVKGPSEISASVKAYFALKLAGIPVESHAMITLRLRILELGGIQAANSYTKVNLSLFDLYPREGTPSIPPEIMLLPGKLLYQMSSWTRAIVISLAIVHAHDPKRPVPAGFNLDELFIPGKSTSFETDDSWLSWRSTFVHSDKILKLWESYGFARIRKAAVRKCEHWMLERMKHAEGLGAIYPPMQYSIMALDVLGYAPDSPVRAEAVRQFESLIVDDGKTLFFQPCFSPVWDTAIASYALGEAGYASDPSLTKAADWLLEREIRRNGDWSVKRPYTDPSGWAFEFRNDWYPDIDDTAMVMLAFPHMRAASPSAQNATRRRALDWLIAMQSKDGGWAAFDVDNNWEILTHVPFADHNAMLDPTCADITGRTLEALAANGLDREHAACKRAIDYLIRTQLSDGSWYGRWGVAYIYGTCFALRGLRAMGEDDHEPWIQRANEWLRSIQNSDGGWGESCASYDNDIYTPAESTPSQTAWALMGLMAGGDTRSSSVLDGIAYLVETQNEDGTWSEELATGTGFPKVFYLNYHYYRLYFPLLALATFAKLQAAELVNTKAMLLPICQAGEPVLRQRARELTPEEIVSSPLQELIASMFETMRAAPGVGLAAPQIGMNLQLAVIEDPADSITKLPPDYRAERQRDPVAPHVIINPRLTLEGPAVGFFEGCLSVAGFTAIVDRALVVRVDCLNERAEPVTIHARGWYARILQHEIDHLNGTLYIDRMISRSFMGHENFQRHWKDKTMAETRETLGGG